VSVIGAIRRKLAKVIGASMVADLALRRRYLESLRNERRKFNSAMLSGYGYKIFSQTDEDGIIAEIFRRIGHTNKRFVEFGVGDGLENNTAALLFDGWSGLWIESSKEYCKKINEGMRDLIDAGRLNLINAHITRNNINKIIASFFDTKEIDLLSIDIDGNDAYVLNAISAVEPRVVIVEYNAKFGPFVNYCMKYNENYVWKKTDGFGASLKYYENLMAEKGYYLVGCNLAGTNAFFVRADLVDDRFAAPFTAEHHFEPARYELTGLPSGHPPSYESFSMIQTETRAI